MSLASPGSTRSSSRSAIEISHELKPRDLNVMLKDVERTGSKEVFLYAKDGRVYVTSRHEDVLNSRPERSEKLLSMIKQTLEKTSHSRNANDVFLDIRKVAKALKPGRHDSGVRKENDYVAVGTRQLSGLLAHKHDPLAQEQRAERQQIIGDALMGSIKGFHAICSLDAKLDDDEDRAPLLEQTRAIGKEVAAALVEGFKSHNANFGKHELANFRMSFFDDKVMQGPLKDLLKDKCSHRLREDISAAFSQGLQEAIGNVSTDGKHIASENPNDAPLQNLRLDDRKLRFGDFAGKGAHGSVNIYRSTSDPAFSVAVKSPINSEEESDEVLNRCRSELQLHLEAQGMGHENVVEVMGVLRLGMQLHIAMEDCSLGTLDGFLTKRLASAIKKDDLDAEEHRLVALTLARDVLAGMHHLHESSVVLHLDMKPQNVFIGIDGKAKIGDFDRSMKGGAVDNHVKSVPDTPQYVSPSLLAKVSAYRDAINEINKQETADLRKTTDKVERKKIIKQAREDRDAVESRVQMSQRDDAYAVGVTLFEILYGVNPFLVEGLGTETVDKVAKYESASTSKRRRMLFEGRPLPAALRNDEGAIQDLLMKLLDPDEDERASVADALASSLFTDEDLGSDEARALIRRVGRSK